MITPVCSSPAFNTLVILYFPGSILKQHKTSLKVQACILKIHSSVSLRIALIRTSTRISWYLVKISPGESSGPKISPSAGTIQYIKSIVIKYLNTEISKKHMGLLPSSCWIKLPLGEKNGPKQSAGPEQAVMYLHVALLSPFSITGGQCGTDGRHV